MSKWTKILCLILAPLGVVFCFVGYAALTTTLTIEGTAEASPPNAVYIFDIPKDKISYSGASAVPINNSTGEPERIDYPSTKFVSNIKFNRSGKITFQVEIFNGTSTTQIFNVLKKHEGVGDYTYTGVTGSNNPSVSPGQGTKILPGESEIFTVTITGNRATTNLMLYEFEFVLDTADLTQKASQAVLDRFKQIINTPSEYQQLKTNMNAGDTGGYIANSEGAEQVDKDVINELFGDTLKLTFEDNEYPITILAKEESVCSWNDIPGSGWWDQGTKTEERALYMTADSLNGALDPAPVFVAVFHQLDDGTWVQVGEEGVIFEGTAPVIDYSGQNQNGTGNFQTNEWVSSKSYFGLPAGSTLKELMEACDPNP